MGREIKIKNQRGVEMKKDKLEEENILIERGIKAGKEVQRKEDIEEELSSLLNILNTNDRFRIGEIEKRIKKLKEKK